MSHWIDAFADWVRSSGALGLVGFTLLFLALTLTMLPTVQLYIAAGTIYGVVWGTALTTILSVAGALATSLIVRTRIRRWVERRLERHKKLAAIDRGVGEHGFWIALLLRASPAPYGVLNYALALTKISLWRNLATTALGMLPTNLLYAYAGGLLHGMHGSAWHQAALWGGVAALLVAGGLIAWVVKRSLSHA